MDFQDFHEDQILQQQMNRHSMENRCWLSKKTQICCDEGPRISLAGPATTTAWERQFPAFALKNYYWSEY